jgi:hypothetical protein
VDEWLRLKAEAVRYVAALGEAALVESLARKLERSYTENGALPGHDELQQLVWELLSELGVAKGQAPDSAAGREVTTVVVSGAIAQFLIRTAPSLEKLTAAAKVEFYVDTRSVALLIARGDAAGAWCEMLRKLTFGVGSINDDEYQASDELERWQKELKRPIPTWHEGNFPHMGLSVEQLVAELLRALNEKEWLKFLDRLPIPALIEGLLWKAHAERSPEQILDWVRDAPLAFDEAGRRTESALIFILERHAYGLIEGALMRRVNWGREAGATDQAIGQLEAPRKELAATMLNRADGQVLLTELGAQYMIRAQAGSADSTRTNARQELHYAFGLAYANALPSSSELFNLVRSRAEIDPARSFWGLWLVSTARAASELAANVKEARTVLGNSWPWLVELLSRNDSGLSERHSRFAHWTESLGAAALSACDEPLATLEETWNALAPQRLERRESQYAKDAWSTSRFLIRVGFVCSRTENRRDQMAALWSASMDMALTAWLARSSVESFSEVSHGMAHLAAGELDVAAEPLRTFEYLVGELNEVSEMVLVLLANGFDPARLVATAAAARIDLLGYLRLNGDPRRQNQVAKAMVALEGALGTRLPDEDIE